jgi:hypothetical protein
VDPLAPSNASNAVFAAAIPLTIGTERMLLMFSSPLTNAGGAASLLVFGEAQCTTADCSFFVVQGSAGGGDAVITGSPAPVPEPGSLWLLGTAGLGLVGHMRLRGRSRRS